jgi:hypothetical protein
MTELEQHVFTETAKHLLDQGYPSKAPDGRCAYKDPRGNSCAIGRWITMRDYRHVFEAVDPGELTSDVDNFSIAGEICDAVAAGMGCDVDEIPWGLIGYLQNIHDNVPPADWYAHLRDLANDKGLNWPEEIPI